MSNWTPTNELRWFCKKYETVDSEGFTTYSSVNCLQQKWELLEANGEYYREWRDVPEVEE